MRKSPVATGVLLIAIGLALFFLQGRVETRQLLFIVLGGLFLAMYLRDRSYGYLVPGGILTGLGVGLILEQWAWPLLSEAVPFGLGVGFLLIYVLDQLTTREGGWWPLIPGTVLVLVGIGLPSQFMRWLFREGWPLGLVAIGVFLVLRGLLGGNSLREDSTLPPVPPGEDD